MFLFVDTIYTLFFENQDLVFLSQTGFEKNLDLSAYTIYVRFNGDCAYFNAFEAFSGYAKRNNQLSILR